MHRGAPGDVGLVQGARGSFCSFLLDYTLADKSGQMVSAFPVRGGRGANHFRRRQAGALPQQAATNRPRQDAGKFSAQLFGQLWVLLVVRDPGHRAPIERRERQRPRVIPQAERDRLLALGPDLAAVWQAATTTPRDRKELLRTLLEEVIIQVERDQAAAHLTLRWKGGALSDIDLALPRSRPATIRTDEDTVALVRRLAVHYPDSVIAGIFNRQGRSTAYAHRFIAGRVGNLRHHWGIPCFEPTAGAPEGEPLTINIRRPRPRSALRHRPSIACSMTASSQASS